MCLAHLRAFIQQTNTQKHIIPKFRYKDAYGGKVIDPNRVLQVNFHN